LGKRVNIINFAPKTPNSFGFANAEFASAAGSRAAKPRLKPAKNP
jgi:hypothetical protein